jgi:hypothetical protein
MPAAGGHRPPDRQDRTPGTPNGRYGRPGQDWWSNRGRAVRVGEVPAALRDNAYPDASVADPTPGGATAHGESEDHHGRRDDCDRDPEDGSTKNSLHDCRPCRESGNPRGSPFHPSVRAPGEIGSRSGLRTEWIATPDHRIRGAAPRLPLRAGPRPADRQDRTTRREIRRSVASLVSSALVLARDPLKQRASAGRGGHGGPRRDRRLGEPLHPDRLRCGGTGQERTEAEASFVE